MRTLLYGVLLVVALIDFPGAAANAEPSGIVFISNYDAKLEVDDSICSLQAQARVRDGSTFPIECGEQRVDVTVVALSDGRYRAELNIFETSQNAWFKINSERLVFESAYAIPVEFNWTFGDMVLDLAISITVAE